MAESKLEILLSLKDEASQKLKQAGKNVGQFSADAKKAGVALTAFGAAGMLAITNFSKAAIVQKNAVRTLGFMVENTGASWDSYKDKVLAATAAIQAKTNYGDEEQLKILSAMVPVLGDVDKAMAALPAILDAAAASGLAATSVSKTLTLALAGQSEMARSVGIRFEKSMDFGERLALVLSKVGGAAEANRDPFTQMGNSIGDLKEVIGTAILPILTPLLTVFKNLAELVAKVPTPILAVAAAFGTLAVIAATLAGPLLLLIGFWPAIALGLAAIKLKALTTIPALLGLAKALWVVVAAKIAMLAAMGPAGWAILAGAAAVTAVAAVGVAKGVKSLTTPSMAEGGVVPGPIGKPRLIEAHGGEVYAGVGRTFARAPAAASEIHIHVGAFMGTERDARDLARMVQKYNREGTRLGT